MTYDALVIGAGPAGLAAAVQLARLRRTCLVVDDAAGRSLWSQVTRNYLGFPDGVSAADLRLLGQRQAVAYGADLRDGTVTGLRRARRKDGGFDVTVTPRHEPVDAAEEAASPGLADNRRREARHGLAIGEKRTRRETVVAARTVLVATGVTDAFPAFEGRDLCVGISLFWCIVCDGYEAIDRSVAVVGDDEDAISTAIGLQRFTKEVALVTGRQRSGAPARRLAALAQQGVRVHRGRVRRYEHVAGRIERLVLDGGAAHECEMVFVSAPKRPRSQLGRRLGARVDRPGYLEIDKDGRASVPGLYAAGDVTAGHAHQVTTAAHQGVTAATAINYDLYRTDD